MTAKGNDELWLWEDRSLVHAHSPVAGVALLILQLNSAMITKATFFVKSVRVSSLQEDIIVDADRLWPVDLA